MAPIQRLLVATPLYPPDSGGPATYAKLLEQELPKRGIEVIVVKFGDIRHLPKCVRHVAYFFSVLRAAKNVDAVFALDPVSVGFPASVAARLRRKRFFVKVVGDYAWEQGRQRFGVTMNLDAFVLAHNVPFFVACLRVIQRHVARTAERVLVPSFYLQGVVGTWGIQAERVRVVYNAIEERVLGVCPQEVLQAARPIVLYIGRLVPWKHVDGIMDAVEIVTKNGIPATLVIVGAGPQKSVLTKKAATLESTCVFLGEQNPADTQAILANADMLVLNSSYEGLSHVLIEGLVRGKAIIATRAGGNGELITDGSNGLLIPVGDTEALAIAVTKLYRDEALRASLEEGARASAETFSLAKMISGTMSALT